MLSIQSLLLFLSAILADYVLLFAILKYAGAAYPGYLGIQAFAKSLRRQDLKEEKSLNLLHERSCLQVVKSGFLTNMLNPLSILYFMVLYQQFLKPGANDSAVCGNGRAQYGCLLPVVSAAHQCAWQETHIFPEMVLPDMGKFSNETGK